MKMTKKPAKNVTGFLLWMPDIDKHVFRVYDEAKNYVDYTLQAQDIQVTIKANDLALIEEGGYHRLDWD